jgi:hypothetical protein
MNIMSSWANIRVPRKRDVSQIPEELRPAIVTRAQRSEVILSESFQTSTDTSYDYPYMNTIVEPNTARTTNTAAKKKESVVPNPREYVTKKIEVTPSPNAFELRFNGKSYVFVILRHLRRPQDNDLWISSYNSIRKYYTNKIIIIDDNSTINTVNGKLFQTEVIPSDFSGAGEILPYYYFLQSHWADNMIFFHDSMFLNRPFRDAELQREVAFHWHFTPNGFDDTRKITSYLSLLHNHKEVMEFYQQPNAVWKGCSGGATIMNYDVLVALETKYKVFTILTMAIKTRKERECFERVFGILLYVEGLVNDQNCSNFGDIMRYPNAFESENNNLETAAHQVRQRGYDTAVLKVWRGR